MNWQRILHKQKQHNKLQTKRGGLFLAQFPGKARRSVFKVFSSIYWETFKQKNKQTTYKQDHKTGPPTVPINIRRQPAPADGWTSEEDPKLPPWKKNKENKSFVKRVCVDKYK